MNNINTKFDNSKWEPGPQNPKWLNPLPGQSWSLPLGKYQEGGFGSKRQYSFNCGIDLFCEHNQPLVSVEDGIVVSIRDFSNQKNERPWLNKTRVVLIEGKTGVIAYCSVKEQEQMKIGQEVKAGDFIGNVIRINKKKKRKDICMLHLELYRSGTRKRVAWSYSFPKPNHLLDPTSYLLDIIVDQQVVYRRRASKVISKE